MDTSLNIIAVDDTEMNLVVIEEMAKDVNHTIQSFISPHDALDHIQNNRVDIMFVDYMMPDMDGVTLLSKAKALQPELISIMVTAVNDDDALKIRALEEGATDFLTKPINIAEFQAKLKNFASMKKMERQLSRFNEELQERVEEATQNLIEREHEALEVLSKAAEYKDEDTASHVSRVAHYSKLLGNQIGLSEADQNILFYASPLHDIGKLGIADAVLLKPGKLDADEFAIMQTHASKGGDILLDSKNPYLKAGKIISETHHEKYDGSGYPKGLKGDDIPIFGRITALADVFDALTSTRPYKKAWRFEDAVAFVQEQSGHHFDPKLVELFIQNIDKVKEIFHTFANQEG